MIVLTNSRKPEARFETITLDDGGTFKVQITPPDQALFVRGNYQATFADMVLLRLQCVTGWQDVTDESGKPVAFSADAFLSLLQQCPTLTEQILKLLQPFFDGPTKEREKNSDGPQSATT